MSNAEINRELTALERAFTLALRGGKPLHRPHIPMLKESNVRTAGTVRLDAGTTKNDDGRVFPFTEELRAVLETQRAEADRLKQTGKIVAHVFHRDGRPICKFVKAWKVACIAAGVRGRIPHDLRRTAVRNLVRVGVPDRVAMRLTGHKTRSVFERYNIVSDGDLATAAERIDASAQIAAKDATRSRRIRAYSGGSKR